jgi:hypothetical protein
LPFAAAIISFRLLIIFHFSRLFFAIIFISPIAIFISLLPPPPPPFYFIIFTPFSLFSFAAILIFACHFIIFDAMPLLLRLIIAILPLRRAFFDAAYYFAFIISFFLLMPLFSFIILPFFAIISSCFRHCAIFLRHYYFRLMLYAIFAAIADIFIIYFSPLFRFTCHCLPRQLSLLR